MHDAWTPEGEPNLGASPVAAKYGAVTAADDHRVAGARFDALRGGRVGELPAVHRLAGRHVLHAAAAGMS